MVLARAFVAALAVVIVGCGGTAVAPSPSPVVTASPAPTPPPPAGLLTAGVLRVAVNPNNVAVVTKDASGQFRGINVDLGNEIARRTGARFEPVEYSSPQNLTETGKAGKWDVAIAFVDAARQAEYDFTYGFVEIDNTYLVPPGSTIRAIADVDRAGVRVVVRRGTPPDTFLSANLKQAQVVRVDGTPDQALEFVRTGKAEALALSRDNLLALAEKLPGSRVLDERFGSGRYAIAVAKGKAEVVSYLNAILEDLRSTGFIQAAITRSGVRGVQVSPPRT